LSPLFFSPSREYNLHLPSLPFTPCIQQVITMICQFCGIEAPTKKVSFHQNIGMLVMRMSKSASGNMCKSCVHKTFWTFEPINLFLGWWGVISVLINVVIIPWNLIQYLLCLPMEAVPPDAQIPQLTDDVVDRLSPHTENLVAQLNSGETFDRVADNIAMQAGVTRGQVALYVQALIAASENNRQ